MPNEVTRGDNIYESEGIPPCIFDVGTKQKLVVSCFVLWIDFRADLDIEKNDLLTLSGIEGPSSTLYAPYPLS